MIHLFRPRKKTAIARLKEMRDRFDSTIPKRRFNMSRYVTKYNAQMNCGYICCLVGWLPAIFPAIFRWSMEATGWTVRARYMSFDTQRHVERFFRINSEVFSSLFAGKELVVDGRVLIPAVVDMRSVSKGQALRRVDIAIRLMEKGRI